MLEFIIELRQRLIKSLIFLSLTFIACFIFIKPIFLYISQPIIFNSLSASIIATSLTSTISVPMKLSFYLAMLISLPFFVSQAWLFISPALFKHERLSIVPLLILSILMLISGIAFALFVMYPITVKFLIAFAPDGVNVMADIGSILDLILGMSLGAGLAFQVPVITNLLILLDITTAKKLKRYRPLIIILSLFLGMLLTPPDVISQVTLAIPMWLLFEIGLLLPRFYPAKTSRLPLK